MSRLLRYLAFALCLAIAAPASAQMNFKGLNLGGSKAKKKKKKKNGSSTTTTQEKDEEEEKTEDKGASTDTGSDAQLPTGGLDLTQPDTGTAKTDTTKKDDKGPAKQAPAMSFEAVDVSGKTADRQKLDAALNQFKNENYEQAALSSYELIQDPNLAGLHLEARYLLAKSLYRMGMYHSALTQFSKVLERGDQGNKFFKPSLEWLFFISHKTVNESVILDEIARYSNYKFPEKFQNEFRYLLARYHFVRGRALDQVDQKQEADKSFDEVKRLVLLIPRDDPFYPRAKYLEGLSYFRENTETGFNNALNAFKEVIRLTRPNPNKKADVAKIDQSLREQAFMQLARTHYGHRQNRYAIYYYNKIERGTGPWLESLFEASWANYRIGQYEQALGNLITLSSPFFRDEYFPEALILKAVIYYENCRYRESTIILEDFNRIYNPVFEELQTLLSKNMEASAYYDVLADVQKKNKEGLQRNNTDVILERILRLALSDKDLKKTNDSILELESEIDGYSQKSDTFKFSNLSKELLEALKVQREELIKKAGIMAKGKLETELAALKRLLGNAERIKFETVDKEKQYLEESLREGGKVDIVKTYKYTVAVADDQLYWPYEGEYWRDELGTYQYTLTKGCREKPTGRDTTASQ